MQNGSMIRAGRQQGPDVWEFRWREAGPDGKRKHRRMVVGSVNNLPDEVAARQAITALHVDMNPRDARVKAKPIAVSELVDHYRQRELSLTLFGRLTRRRLPMKGIKEVDFAALGKISARGHQRWRS